MAKEPQSLCNLCAVPLTMEHILIECPSYHTQRTHFFGPSPTLKSILSDKNINQDFFEFLDESNLTEEL